MATGCSILPGKSHDSGAWRAAVHGVSQSLTGLSTHMAHFVSQMDVSLYGIGMPLPVVRAVDSCLLLPRMLGRR